jgi:hypothetical protein
VHYVRGLLVGDLRRGRQELIRTASFLPVFLERISLVDSQTRVFVNSFRAGERGTME